MPTTDIPPAPALFALANDPGEPVLAVFTADDLARSNAEDPGVLEFLASAALGSTFGGGNGLHLRRIA